MNKMDIIEELKRDHIEIERELIELEEVINSEIINYPNLIHTLTKVYEIWNNHEEKEEILFPLLEEIIPDITIPVEKMKFEHRELRPHKEAIKKAINSGDDSKIKDVLEKSGKTIVLKLKAHMDYEDEILYRTTLPELDEEKKQKLIEALNKNGK